MAQEAAIDLIGGHTIKTDEPIYGLSVTGLVHPQKIVSNAGARAGALLVLTKPLGLGIITTAAKQDADTRHAIDEAISIMTSLNSGACDAMQAVGVQACTDVTGFGLLGHLRNVLVASEVSAEIWLDRVPVIEAAWEYVRAGITPGGTHANHRFLAEWADWSAIDRESQLILCDAQTSGGLLIAVAEDKAEALVAALGERRTSSAAVVGRIEASSQPTGYVRVLQSAHAHRHP